MTQGGIEQAIAAAVAHQRAGRAAEAAEGFRRILMERPDCAEALCGLGLLVGQSGQMEAAVELFARAARSKPGWADAHYNLGIALEMTGRGVEAAAAYGAAIAVRADYGAAYNNLGNVLRELGRVDEAIGALDRAMALLPGDAGAYSNLGTALVEARRFDEAIAAFGRAAALRPDVAAMHLNLGSALAEKELFAQAIAAYERALAIDPNEASGYYKLGIALKDMGRAGRAIEAFERALALRPDYARAHCGLGIALGELNRHREAIAAYERAIALSPEYPEAHWNLAHSLLAIGDLRRGWPEYEWRWRVPTLPAARDFGVAQWDGGELSGRTILLHAEQGLGDMIQFARYAALVAGRGGRVILECPAVMRRLFAGIGGVAQLVVRGEALPGFDVHCPLASLPMVFGTTVETIPAGAPYLAADAELARAARQKLAGASGARVGLVWAGNRRPDPRRTVGLAAMGALGDVPGITFVSLQHGAAAQSAKSPPTNMRLMELADAFGDLADTAAVIANLDLTITIDTSVAHLAGAMGKPVWVLLPFAADWRWLLDREDCPWYPTMQLFRQTAADDWNNAIRAVAQRLRSRFSGRTN